MTPLWKIDSGLFAGWHTNDAFYDAEGQHIGYLAGHVAYRLDGRPFGEIYMGEWIGARPQMTYPDGEAKPQHEAVAHARLENRPGLEIDGWTDPIS